jgi:hypothetical protein
MRKGKSVYHCHGRRKGKLIRRYKTVKAAKKAHAGMNRKKKG